MISQLCGHLQYDYAVVGHIGYDVSCNRARVAILKTPVYYIGRKAVGYSYKIYVWEPPV